MPISVVNTFIISYILFSVKTIILKFTLEINEPMAYISYVSILYYNLWIVVMNTDKKTIIVYSFPLKNMI